MNAVDGYDPDRGVIFSAYAKKAIVRKVMRAIRCSSGSSIVKLTSTKQKEFSEIESKINLGENVDLPKNFIRVNNSVSIEAAGEDSHYEVVDYCSFINDIVDKDKYEILYSLLGELKDRYCKVLIHYFGLFGVERKTYKEIGSCLNLSPERIRQIACSALIKIRSLASKRNLEVNDFF